MPGVIRIVQQLHADDDARGQPLAPVRQPLALQLGVVGQGSHRRHPALVREQQRCDEGRLSQQRPGGTGTQAGVL